MAFEFDPAKDAANIVKHGVSLAAAADLELVARLVDERFTEEVRYRAYGYIAGVAHCLAYTLRGENVRAIMLRRAHQDEIDAYVGDRLK